MTHAAQPIANSTANSPGRSTATTVITTFLGAFLLFQVQPLAARTLLPSFGGGALVWASCLLFFQTALLIGNGYAALSTRLLRPRSQAAVHLLVMAASLLFVPLAFGDAGLAADGGQPQWQILAVLAATLGVPVLVTASTTTLVQSWYAQRQTRSPYSLFAVSNAASLLGLVTFPVFFEPLLSLSSQRALWSGTYGIYLLFFAIEALSALRRRADIGVRSLPAPPAIPGSTRMLWLAFSALGVVLLMATTSEITTNLAPVPLLWILPFSLYLGSYVLCFGLPAVYATARRRRLWFLGFAVLAVPTHWMALSWGAAGFPVLLALACLCLWFGCVVCHGELERLKPEPGQLGAFYLALALGGALGGTFVSLVAPAVFNDLWEYPAALAGIFFLAGASRARSLTPGGGAPGGSDPGGGAPGGGGRPFAAATKLAFGGASVVIFVLAALPMWAGPKALDVRRNAYGRLSVIEVNSGGEISRELLHGRIRHGSQRRDHPREPTLYYRRGSGIQLAFESLDDQRSRRVGIVGLGTGSMAAYGRPGDRLRFYELDPAVRTVARSFFTFLRDCPSLVEIVLGDARVELRRELAAATRAGDRQSLQLLAVDAFSGDAIPIHLITLEAFELYFAHLEADGLLALHLTNAHLDLAPVARTLARRLGREAIVVRAKLRSDGPAESTWVLVSSRRTFDDHPELRAAATPWPADVPDVVWTDEHASLLPLFR